MRALVLAFGMAVGLAVVSAVQAASLVVISSTDPAVKPGEVIDSTQGVTVSGGGKVTLISDQGKKVVLEGPFAGPVTAGGSEDPRGGGVVASLSKLITKREAITTKLGTFRSAKGPQTVQPDDPWFIDVSKGGHHCVRHHLDATLWRPDKDGGGTAQLSFGAQGPTWRLVWPKGQSTLAWPRNVKIKDGARYLIQIPDTAKPMTLILHTHRGEFPTEAHAAAWMATAKCSRQAAQMIDGMQ